MSSDPEVRDGVELTNLDQQLFDGAEATKRDLVDYLDAVSERIVLVLRDRPLSVVRVRPGQPPFMQKNVPKYTPDWVRTVSMWAEASKRDVSYALCNDRRTLLWFANQRAVEYHPTLVLTDAWDRQTHLILDIDPPPAANFSFAARAAQLIRQTLADAGMAGTVKTSGAKGLHVVVPLDEQATMDEVAAATRAIAARAERLDPVLATTAYVKDDREGKVFLDSTRSGGATVVAAYSPRVRPGVPVSFPLAWEDLDRVTPADFTVHTAIDLLADRDPWAANMPAPQPLNADLVEEGRAIPVARVQAMHEGKRRARARRRLAGARYGQPAGVGARSVPVTHVYARKVQSSRSTYVVAAALVGVLAATSFTSTMGGAQAAGAGDDRTARGTVFYPNPVQQLGLQDLVDHKDADDPVFAPAYQGVTLTDLDDSGRLVGSFVAVKSSTGKQARAVDGAFDFRRDSDQFEQVMGYYWVTTAQAYLQHLGFGGTLRPVNQRQIELRINQFGGDNSFFREDKANITLGKGGVDDGEDAEVIVHEYGHSVQDSQVAGFGTTLESGSIGEGFSDYLAVAVTSWATGTPTLTPEACVADWDSVSYTNTAPHCLRRLDEDKRYPKDVVGEVHADGEIWSRALWDIRAALGDTRASTLIIDAQFDFAANTTFRAAALATVAAGQRLYGPSTAQVVRAAFVARGIL